MASILHQIKNAFQRYPETFSKCCKAYDQINQRNNYVLKFKLEPG